MPIKAIVCDMDGTLLTAAHDISPKTQELLLTLQQKGIIYPLPFLLSKEPDGSYQWSGGLCARHDRYRTGK